MYFLLSGISLFWASYSRFILEELHFLGQKYIDICGIGSLLKKMVGLDSKSIDSLFGNNVVEAFVKKYPICSTNDSDPGNLTNSTKGGTNSPAIPRPLPSYFENPSICSFYVRQGLENFVSDSEQPR